MTFSGGKAASEEMHMITDYCAKTVGRRGSRRSGMIAMRGSLQLFMLTSVLRLAVVSDEQSSKFLSPLAVVDRRIL